MATIRKLPSGKYQAVARLNNLKPLYASFPTRTKTKQRATTVECDKAPARKLALGEDLNLRQAVQIESHGRSIRCIIPLFSEWADEFLQTTTMADKSAIGRVKFRRERFEDKLAIDITPEAVDDALLEIAKRGTGSTATQTNF